MPVDISCRVCDKGGMVRHEVLLCLFQTATQREGSMSGSHSHGTAGLMFGPALLGLLADFTSVQTALCANAALLAVVMGVFALAVSV